MREREGNRGRERKREKGGRPSCCLVCKWNRQQTALKSKNVMKGPIERRNKLLRKAAENDDVKQEATPQPLSAGFQIEVVGRGGGRVTEWNGCLHHFFSKRRTRKGSLQAGVIKTRSTRRRPKRRR